MPEISRFYGIVIKMYPEDHPMPHFHVAYSGWAATILIQTLEIDEGNLPNTAARLVKRWARLHQDELLSNWKMVEAGMRPNKIKPLE